MNETTESLLDQVRTRFEMTPEHRQRWSFNQGTVLKKGSDVCITLAYGQSAKVPDLLWLSDLLQPAELLVGATTDYDFGYVRITAQNCMALKE